MSPLRRVGTVAMGRWQCRDFSLAFCMEGRPMQPAYRIEVEVSNASDDPDFPLIRRSLKTTALDTTWYFVPQASDSIASGTAEQGAVRLRCEAGQPCPREGWWLTPAKADSRRHFKPGELMPAFSTDYGATIWQWDEQQGQ